MLNNVPALWQFVIFAVVLAFLASWGPTSKFAVAIGAAILLSQLFIMSKKGLI